MFKGFICGRGLFYVIKTKDDRFFRGLSGCERVLLCDTFDEAAKIFDLNATYEEVCNIAKRLDGDVFTFTYSIKS